MRLIPRAATLAGLLTIVGVLGIDATPAQAQYFGLGRGFSLSIGTGLGGFGLNYGGYGGYGGYGLGYGGYGLGYPGYSSYSYGYPGYSSYYSYGYPGYSSTYSYRSYGYPGYGSSYGYGYGYPGYRSYSSGYRGYYGGYGGLNPTNTLGFPGGSSTVSGYYMPGYGFIR
jgi:hypothetical protein